MKIRIDNFKGEIPRIAKRALPDGFAALAENCKLTSGDLVPFREDSVYDDGCNFGTQSVALIKRDDHPTSTLESPDPAASWAQGYAKDVPADEAADGVGQSARTYYTSKHHEPRVTTYEMATGFNEVTGLREAPRPWPASYLRLGVPYPFQFDYEATDPPDSDPYEPVATEVEGSANYEELKDFRTDTLDGYEVLPPEYKNDSQSAQIKARSSQPHEIIFRSTISPAAGSAFQGSIVGFLDHPRYRDYRSNFRITEENLETNGDDASFFHTFYVNCNSEAEGFGVLIRRWHVEGSHSPSGGYWLKTSVIIFKSDGEGAGFNESPIDTNHMHPIAEFTSTDDNGIWTQIGRISSLDVQIDVRFDELRNVERIKCRVSGPMYSYSDGGQSRSYYPNGTIEVTAEDSAYFDSSQTATGNYFAHGVRMFGDASQGDPELESYLQEFRVSGSGRILSSEAGLESEWIYTFVNTLGEEGPPSFPSNPAVKIDDNTVEISNIDWQQPAYSEFGLTKIRLYRRTTGGDGSVFRFVKEVDIPAAFDPSFAIVDDVDALDLGEPIVTTAYALPPAKGQHITALPNGIMVVADGREIAPSEQYQPHAYPLEYRLLLDYPVVAMAAINTTLVVLTTASPYLVVGQTPDNLSIIKIPANYSCVSPRSVAMWKDFGVVYASDDGIVAVNESGARLISESFFTKEEWEPLREGSSVGVVHDDVYFLFTGNTYSKPPAPVNPPADLPSEYSLVFDPRESGRGVTRIAKDARAAVVDYEGDRLYVLDGTTLREHEGDFGYKQMRWFSQTFQLPYPMHFTAAEVRLREVRSSEPLKVVMSIYRNNEDTPFAAVEFTAPRRSNIAIAPGSMKYVVPDLPNVLPLREVILPDEGASGFGRMRELTIAFTGNAIVESIELAEDMDELS